MQQTKKTNNGNQADALVNQNQELSQLATIVIIGDSMLKNVDGWKLGKEVGRRVVVKSFAGATTSDMSHYLKPTVGKKPDQIVLHFGTNDTEKLAPHQIVDSIVNLAKEVENNSDVWWVITMVGDYRHNSIFHFLTCYYILHCNEFVSV